MKRYIVIFLLFCSNAKALEADKKIQFVTSYAVSTLLGTTLKSPVLGGVIAFSTGFLINAVAYPFKSGYQQNAVAAGSGAILGGLTANIILELD